MNVPHTFLGADVVGLQYPPMHPIPTSCTEQDIHSMQDISQMQSSVPMFQSPGLIDLDESEVPGLMGMAQMNQGNIFQSFPPTNMDRDQVLDRERLEELLHTLTANKFRKKRRGKMGSGKHLTYEDLEKHFGVGLKEAAAALKICPTTLKRACRRCGIPRWPSRHTSRTLTEIPSSQAAMDNNAIVFSTSLSLQPITQPIEISKF